MTLVSLVADEIHGRGPMSFERFMELALYDPNLGYYAAGRERVGWRGDFVTAPELDPGFGALWARAFEDVWNACGRTGEFHVVEIGPGEGAFARAVLESISPPFADAISYHMVEPNQRAVERQRSRLAGLSEVHWYASMDDVPPLNAGCVFANEVVDNLPVRLVERSGGEMRELLVDCRDDSLQFVPAVVSSAEVADFFSTMGCTLPEGHRAEIPGAAIRLVSAAVRLITTGAIAIVDYGDDAAGLLRRPRGSLLCYSSTGVDERPLENPGAKDITVHANWTALTAALAAAGLEVAGPIAQSTVLRSLGWDELAAAARAESYSATGAGVVRAVSRRAALASLVDRGGLGGFGVLVGAKSCRLPSFADPGNAKAGHGGPALYRFEDGPALS